MRLRSRAHACIALFTLLLANAVAPFLPSGAAVAQNPNGQLIVTVKDPSEAVVPGATVTVANEGTGVTQTVAATGDGVATFAALPAGFYTVTVQAQGFQQAVFEQVKIEVGKDVSRR